jgi:pimeloyl-ACP methyl ester carboxylesterase
MTTRDPRARVVIVDGVPMSALVAAAPEPRAVIVAVHGGATSAAYFDCPGHPRLSLLRSAAAQGFSAIALDRPGYGASGLYHDAMADPDSRVAFARGAVDKVLGDGGRGAGLFLLAHSAGCELALRMAVDDCAADVVGIELAGTGLRYSPEAKAVISEATATSRPAGLRDLLWQPTEFYPEEVLTGALSAPGAAYESEVTANWPRRDFPEVAARVDVPVQFSAGDHERVWESTPEALAAIAALFTSSPRVLINEMTDSGHNLSVGLTADAYHARVLSFVEECVAGSADLEAG